VHHSKVFDTQFCAGAHLVQPFRASINGLLARQERPADRYFKASISIVINTVDPIQE
jgi:hypothetical protein